MTLNVAKNKTKYALVMLAGMTVCAQSQSLESYQSDTRFAIQAKAAIESHAQSEIATQIVEDSINRIISINASQIQSQTQQNKIYSLDDLDQYDRNTLQEQFNTDVRIPQGIACIQDFSSVFNTTYYDSDDTSNQYLGAHIHWEGKMDRYTYAGISMAVYGGNSALEGDINGNMETRGVMGQAFFVAPAVGDFFIGSYIVAGFGTHKTDATIADDSITAEHITRAITMGAQLTNTYTHSWGSYSPAVEMSLGSNNLSPGNVLDGPDGWVGNDLLTTTSFVETSNITVQNTFDIALDQRPIGQSDIWFSITPEMSYQSQNFGYKNETQQGLGLEVALHLKLGHQNKATAYAHTNRFDNDETFNALGVSYHFEI